MPLVDLKTDLKSLRYGKDTPGGGYSGQPYIQTPIPDGYTEKAFDYILRNGRLAPSTTLTDVERLTKMFTDLKSINGFNFYTKQNLLSATAVRTQVSGVLNDRKYEVYSTLAQAGAITFGGHLNKQGLNPFALTGAYSNNDNLYGVRIKPTQPKEDNRLVKLYDSIDLGIPNVRLQPGIRLNNGPNVMTYRGGPDAIKGVGNTNIRYASERTGKYNALIVSNPDYFYGKNQKQFTAGDYLKLVGTPETSGASGIYLRLTGARLINNYNDLGQSIDSYNHNVYDPNTTPGNTWPDNTPLIYANNTFTYDQKDIIDQRPNDGRLEGAPSIQDFRKVVRASLRQRGTTQDQEKAFIKGATPLTPNYKLDNFEARTNIGGTTKLGAGNSEGKNLVSYKDGSGIGPIDLINALPIYQSEAVDTNKPVNDLVKFRIAVINNANPTKKTFIHFRAFLTQMQDAYTGTWAAQTYLGRAESFYNYSNFDRKINLGFTVAAQSKEELIEQYKKLNFLASTLAPDYGQNGYMKGNLIQLTVGGYLYEQVGFLTSINYEIPEDSPWEIGIDDRGQSDNSVKELAHMIKVGSFQFTPIHNFAPALQDNTYSDAFGTVIGYGPQQYIALSNGASNNYTNTSNELVNIEELTATDELELQALYLESEEFNFDPVELRA